MNDIPEIPPAILAELLKLIEKMDALVEKHEDAAANAEISNDCLRWERCCARAAEVARCRRDLLDIINRKPTT